MDYIHIEKLVVRGKHGVTALERQVKQKFEISLRMAVGDISRAAKSESLRDTVDYQPIKDRIVEIVGGESCLLIETVAERIVDMVFKDTRIKSIELSIKKPDVWKSGVPGLTVIRARK